MPYAPCWPTRSASDGTYAASEIDVLDDFELDGSGYANHALAHDAAGNLTYDGVFLYTYDPWNHLTQVHRAYHDGSGADGDGDGDTADPERGSLVASFTYDGLGRRVSKAVTNMADLDATYYYYYDGDRCVEVRNGSHDPIKNYVWAPMPVVGDDASVGGPGYVDELVQIIHHLDTGSGTAQTYHWVLQDVNYNVLGVVQAAGALVERYEYAPYGGREVYIQSGANDGRVQSRIEMSRRIPDVVTMLDEPYGLCEIGHQGLMHDEDLGLIHNRARTLHPRLRRFMQRDPAGYVDGMGLYEYLRSGPLVSLDPLGHRINRFKDCLANQEALIRAADTDAAARLPHLIAEAKRLDLTYVLEHFVIPENRTNSGARQATYDRYRRETVYTLEQSLALLQNGTDAICTCDGCNGNFAYTLVPRVGRSTVIYYCPDFFVGPPFLSGALPNPPGESTVGSIHLHELTHLTEDTLDMRSSWLPQQPASAARDAYWYETLHNHQVEAMSRRYIWEYIWR